MVFDLFSLVYLQQQASLLDLDDPASQESSHEHLARNHGAQRIDHTYTADESV